MPGRRVLFTILGFLLLYSTALAASEECWMARLRLGALFPDCRSDANAAAGLALNDIKLSDSFYPEAAIAWFQDKSFAFELSTSFPMKHDVTIRSTSTNAGSVDYMPLHLTVQAHFQPDKDFRPYLGAGLNLTKFTDVKLGPLAGLDLQRTRWGTTIQAGFDLKLHERTYFNFDLKKLFVNTDVLLNNNSISNLKIDPLIVSVGIGWKL